MLGVTVGAVHKWEKKLSVPELGLITEMADFFGVSVDVLLGYEMKDNGLKATLGRLAGCLNAEAPEGPAEAEKALKRFPNSFEIVYMCAVTFMVFGGKNHDEAMLNRAIEQLSPAPDLALIDGNRNSGIRFPSRTIVKGDARCADIAAASVPWSFRALISQQSADQVPLPYPSQCISNVFLPRTQENQ